MDQKLESEPTVAVSASARGCRRVVVALRKCWWLPFLTSLLSLAIAVSLLWNLPATYVSAATIWQTAKVSLPESTKFKPDNSPEIHYAHGELLRSKRMEQLTVERLNSDRPQDVPRGKDGE